MAGRFGLRSRGYALVTLHRPSNVDDPATLRRLMEPILELAARMPVLFPVHPRTAKMLADLGLPQAAGLRTLEPLGYVEFLGLMADAAIVLTDSGGIQEETTVLGVPCVTLRENTERPVTVAEGTNVLAGTDPARIRVAIDAAVGAAAAGGRIPELWDGSAATRIARILAGSLA
jgi:UDP-N-acetylglucosamine 2-epimerase (non-hydrolysing)